MTRHYGKAIWQKKRADQLRRSPLCRYCEIEGRTVAAVIADHIEPHKGDINAFYGNELQSLCKRCHDSTKKKIERRGYDDRIGVDGLPVDPNHPFFRRR